MCLYVSVCVCVSVSVSVSVYVSVSVSLCLCVCACTTTSRMLSKQYCRADTGFRKGRGGFRVTVSTKTRCFNANARGVFSLFMKFGGSLEVWGPDH